MMIGGNYAKVHQHGTRAAGSNQAVVRAKGGLTTKPHPAVDAHGMPVQPLATAGTVADCTRAEALIDGIAAEHLLADRGYDTNRVLSAAREHNAALYQARHLVENGFGKSKEWHGDALCAECGFLPGDMPDMHPGTVG